MQLKATGTTHEAAPGAPIVAGLVPTTTTRLRGMSWINPDHRTTALLCLVRQKSFESRKRPTMQAPLGLGTAFGFGPPTDISQIFQHYSPRQQRIE